MIPVNRPLIELEDISAVVDALNSGWISGEGPSVLSLERELAQVCRSTNAVAVSSGTAACDLLNESAALTGGSVVVAPASTIISTVSHAARLGAKIKPVDVDPETWCIDPKRATEAIDESVDLVWVVHLFGVSADIDPVVDRAKQFGVPVFEDAAEAIGVLYKDQPCGGLADAAVFSFYANKTVTCGEGGAVVTSNAQTAKTVRSLRNLCFQAEERFVHQELGYNFRMPNLAAALAHTQLLRLDRLLARKREIGMRYREGLSGNAWLQLPVAATPYSSNSYWVFGIVLLPDASIGAKELGLRLKAEGIDSRRFFCPLNLQPALLNAGQVSREPMPVAEGLWERGLYLPSGVGTTDEEIDQVIEKVWKCLP